MATLAVDLPRLHPGQLEVAQDSARFKVLACGRRWGKTRLAIVLALVEALQGGRAWWVAPTYGIASIGWRQIKYLVRQVPQTEIREGDREVRLPGGGVIVVKSADNPDSLRGEGLDFVVMDECAYLPEAAWTEAIRPALSDRRGRALFISTPRGRNWFWRLWQRGRDGDEEWQSWRFPTTGNPYIAKSEIEEARRQLPERVFLQEFMAEFIGDQGIVFRRVTEAVGNWREKPYAEGHTYVMGVDWGKSEDFTVLTVIDVSTREVVRIDRFNQIDYMFQVERLKRLASEYRVQAIVAEVNSMGEPLVERLQREGLPVIAFMTSNATKAKVIEELSIAIETKDLFLPKDETLIGELMAYEMKRLPSGLIRYTAPEGMHDDCVMSLALAWYGAKESSAPLLLWSSESW